MLTVLKIKNLALVDDLTWELGPGLVTVTGETGAGKSIIVGALKLILGDRADRNLLRTGETHCTVEAVFQLSNKAAINELLESSGLDACEEDSIVLRRVFSVTGINKQFVNGSPATLGTMKALGDLLVDLHGPHDHQALLAQERQLALLDADAGGQALVDSYREAYALWQEAIHDYEALRTAESVTAQEIELLRFQVEEIQSADLKLNEEVELEQAYGIASNSQRLIESANEIVNRLSEGEMSILSRLAGMQKHIRELERIDDKVSEMVNGFDSAQMELEEVARGFARYLDRMEVNPQETQRLENRIDLIQNLKRKYGSTVEQILKFGENAERKLNAIEGRGDELERLKQRVEEARKMVDDRGKVLSDKRLQFSPQLAGEVSRHLDDLGFKQSKFELALRYMKEPGPHGYEELDFQFAPNPGQPFKPLRVIASSGEMCRVLLALRHALPDQDQVPLLVFDEIDANVGGEIAHAVGRKMAELGQKHQVIAITHMPQVACVAHHHYVVSKEVRDDRTRSTLKKVESGQRLDEISRMLGGGGDATRAMAAELLSAREN